MDLDVETTGEERQHDRVCHLLRRSTGQTLLVSKIARRSPFWHCYSAHLRFNHLRSLYGARSLSGAKALEILDRCVKLKLLANLTG
jgi:hypothetical protein